MSDVKEDALALRAYRKEQREKRRDKNIDYLAESGIEWDWVDKACDHILINGHIDYYLAKTYWYNRRTKKSGYTMLYKLLKGASHE